MPKNLSINHSSKLVYIWNTLPMDYSREGERAIINKISTKYGIPKENIRVEVKFKSRNENGEMVSFSNDIITNMDSSFWTNLQELKILKNSSFEYLSKESLTSFSLIDSP